MESVGFASKTLHSPMWHFNKTFNFNTGLLQNNWVYVKLCTLILPTLMDLSVHRRDPARLHLVLGKTPGVRRLLTF